MTPHRAAQFCMLVLSAAVVWTGEDKLFHSAYFRHVNKVHVTQQSWVVIIVLDFEQYQQGLDAIKVMYRGLLDELHILRPINMIRNSTDEASVNVYTQLFMQLWLEFRNLRVLINKTQLSLKGLSLLHRQVNDFTNREKRHQLPFVSSLLGTLFGTAQHSEIRDMQQYLKSYNLNTGYCCKLLRAIFV